MAAQSYVYSPQTIQDPQDIGNNFPSGICIGPNTTNDPSFPGGLDPSLFGQSAATIRELTFESALAYGYGNGLLIGPQCIYRINPVAYNFNDISGNLDFNTITTGTTVNFQTNTTTPRASQLIVYPDGRKVIQFDHPRSIIAYLNTDGVEPGTESYLTAICRGIDVWGRKLTSWVRVTVPQDDPNGYNAANTPSAFFQLHSITIYGLLVGTIGDSATISFGSGNRFGLPFKLTDFGHVQNYSQWSNPYPDSPTWSEYSNTAIPYYINPNPTVEPLPYTLSYPKEISVGYNIFNPNDLDYLNGNTADVRGFFAPNDTNSYTSATDQTLVDDVGSYAYDGPLTISYYVPGADVFPFRYQQMMNQLQQTTILQGAVGANGWDGFGQTLYGQYNGDTANNCEPNLELLIGPVPYSDF
jgi:hypothetical protein